jgi:hypothetical protein
LEEERHYRFGKKENIRLRGSSNIETIFRKENVLGFYFEDFFM